MTLNESGAKEAAPQKDAQLAAGPGSLRGLPRAFWVVFCGELVNRAGNMAMAFMTFFLAARGLGPAEIGQVMIAFGLGCLASQPIGGVLADRVGRRRTLLVGLLLSAGALAFMGSARGFAQLVVAAAVLGTVSEIYRPAAAALVADVVPYAKRSQAYGLLFWAVNLGYPVAGVTAGLLAANGYWLLFAVDSASCLAFAFIIAVALPRSPKPSPLSASRSSGYLWVLRDRLLVLLLLLNLCNACVYAEAFVAVPLAVQRAGLGPQAYSLTPVLNGLLIVVLQPVSSRLLHSLTRLRVLAIAWLLIVVGMALTGVAASAVEFALTASVWTLGEIAAGGVIAALAADLAPAHSRARYQALFGWTSGAARLGAASVVAVSYGNNHPAILWWTAGAVGATSACLAWKLAPRVERRRIRCRPT